MWAEDLEKEYKKNLFTRAITALAIALPIILIILIENSVGILPKEIFNLSYELGSIFLSKQ